MTRTRSLRTLALAALCASLAACASSYNGRNDVVPAARFQPAEASDYLTQTAWELARWTSVGGAPRAIPTPATARPATAAPLPAATRKMSAAAAAKTGKAASRSASSAAAKPVTPDLGSRPLTIAFTHAQGQRRINGFAGCNSYSADYTVANGLLILTAQPAATMMACASPATSALERDYLAGLTRIVASSVDNYGSPTRLTLTLDNGDILDFARRQDPAAGGQMGATKLVYVNAQRAPCSTGVMQTTCYQVRDNESQPWQLWYGEIAGFDYRPGVIYRISVTETTDANPPQDAIATRWVLDRIVERQVVGY
ncbi:META and DUF4377 domain-containing protein [Alcaligenaceae bacterium A4P071]|nr:META and DUF4377 domain-containing protein [Alcaligenaceae bacterium A4P071]